LFFNVVDRKDDRAYLRRILDGDRSGSLYYDRSCHPTNEEDLLAVGFAGTRSRRRLIQRPPPTLPIMIQPLEIVRRIGDKLIRDTPFAYQLEPARVNCEFANETTAGMQFVDFGRTFGLGRSALACAWTCITAPRDMEV
jgi:hypothetical protein